MIDFIVYIDRLLFSFFNQTIANPVFDVLMPFVTDLNKYTLSFVVVGLIWISLIIWGGKTGRLVAVGLILVIALTDHFNSAIMKSIFDRSRPCHFVGGIFNMENVRLLISCGSGRSFPSSHAANNAAAATFLTWFYPRFKWYFIAFALMIGLSRIYVGVHFPVDIAGGYFVGIVCGFIVIYTIMASDRIYGLITRRKSPAHVPE
jgi:undecaprenyl-diphosphatase